MEADFSGYATKANLKCSDGRTITVDAFKDQDQQKVPLVWQHAHGEPTNVLGHALLENRADGVYCYGFFNDTDMGQQAKKLVQHGDINALSIFANRLVEKSKTVLHGIIREVSLVLAGANPGALIDQVSLAHSDGSVEELADAAVIYTGLTFAHGDSEQEPEESNEEDKEEEVTVQHADGGGKTVQDVIDTLNEEQKNVLYFLVDQAANGSQAAHSDDAPSGEVINEIFHSMSAEQQEAVSGVLGAILEHTDTEAAAAADTDTAGTEGSADNADDTAAHSDTQEGSNMTRNVFEQNDGLSPAGKAASGTSLSHAQQQEIFARALRHGGAHSLKEIVEDYAKDSLQHGIEDIEVLFPDAKNVTNTPDWLARRTEWVAKVLTGTRHVPFSRIKSQTANLTLDEARAKGYVKGNLKKEEFFKVAKRITGPTTIYKKQALDRDDVVDITDFDVVVWLKGEMRLMLEEEIARAVLLGDGRAADDDDKINEESIRPIATDAELYVTRVYVDESDTDYTPEVALERLVLNRRHYRGSGNPVFFTSETFLAQMLLVKDGVNRRIYNTPADVAAALRVSEIVTVELLDEPTSNVVGIMVNLNDYTIGADRGGDVALFDDFDIDYNKLKYLIETRMSGALVKAKSAIVVLRTAPNANLVDPAAPTFNATNHTVTVATTTGITYRNKATNAALTTGSPVTLAPGDELVVVAVPAAGYYLESSANDEYSFTYERGRVSGSLF